MKRNWKIVNDQSKPHYDPENEIIYNTEVLKSNLCDYNNVYILVRGDIITTALNNATLVAFKKSAPFTKYIAKIVGTSIDDVEDLD